MSLFLFFAITLYLSFVISYYSLIIALLCLLVYLGSLIILFCYMWIFLSHSTIPSPPAVLAIAISCIYSTPQFLFFSTLSPLIVASSFLLFISILLFWVILVIVHVLDFSSGGFTH